MLTSLMLLNTVQAVGQEAINRRIAVTFDDLPVASSVEKDSLAKRKITLGILQSLAQRSIPAIGFVNEGKMFSDHLPNGDQVDLLRLWLAAGNALGNHGFSHLDLNTTPLDAFQADVIRGERITRVLLAERKETPRYFRHPFLHTATELDKKHEFEKFLGDHGYQVAPVTIDNSDWIFARAYDLAVQEGDADLAYTVGGEYVTYMLDVFAFYEDQSQRLFERNIDHVLLVHANELNSAWFGSLADQLITRGYEFITIEEALNDPAYESKDTYVGPGGITWLHRWAITRNVDRSMFHGEPVTPPHILKMTELRDHSYDAQK